MARPSRSTPTPICLGCREIVHAAAKQMNELAFFHTFNDVTNEPIAKLQMAKLRVVAGNTTPQFENRMRHKDGSRCHSLAQAPT
jgi:hypothetical protein